MTILRNNDKYTLMVFDPDRHESLCDALALLGREFAQLHPEDHVDTYVMVPRYDTDPAYHARVVLGPNIWADGRFWRRVVELELEHG
jgi:hypothetical protein